VEVVGAAVVLAVVSGTNFLGSGICCSVVDVEFKVLLDFVLIVTEMADVVPADVVLPNRRVCRSAAQSWLAVVVVDVFVGFVVAGLSGRRSKRRYCWRV
jgi:hypothetical protein